MVEHTNHKPTVRTLYVLCELCEVLVHCTNVMSVTLGFSIGCKEEVKLLYHEYY